LLPISSAMRFSASAAEHAAIHSRKAMATRTI
jgi:hypothetical protein